MTKRLERTPKQEEYRKKIAGDLRELRKYGNRGKALAKALLEEEQETPLYKDSATKNLRDEEIKREERNNQIIEIIDTKDYDEVKEYIEHTGNYKLDIDVAKRLVKEGWESLIYFNAEQFRPSDEMIELFLSLDRRDHMDRRDFQWLVDYLFHMAENPKVAGFLTKKSVENLIDARILCRAYVANLCVFRGLNKETLFKILGNRISVEDYETLLCNLGNFNGLDKESFLVLVSYDGDRKHADGLKHPYLNTLEKHSTSGEGNLWENYFLKVLDKFEGLDEEIAKMLIEKGCGHYVAQHPETFGLKKEK